MKRVKFVGRRAGCLLGGAVIALMHSAHAQAQADSSSKDSKSGRASDEIQEVVVTAQRRSELVRDVPLSISAQSGEQLARVGVTDSRDLTSLVPGLKMDRVGGFSVPAIRGVSSQLTQAGVEANVAIYLDGVYQPAQVTGTFDLPDVERVEVLKGPQGTLFGRNATGGAIQVFTKQPSYDTTGQVSASFGNYNEYVLKGFASVPIVENKVAASLSGYLRKADGYNTDLLTDNNMGQDESWLIRGKLRLDPTDKLSILISGFGSRRVDSSATPGLPENGNTVDKFIPGAIVSTEPYDTANNFAGFVSNQYGGSLKGVLDLNFATLTSITAYTWASTLISIDADFGYTPTALGVAYVDHDLTRALSEELTLSSNTEGWLGYTVGAFYYDSDGAYDPLRVLVDIPVAPPSLDVGLFGRQDTKAYAGFGEIFIDPVERLRLIAGVRYSYEERTLFGAVTAYGLPNPGYVQKNKKSFDGVTPRFSIRYEVVDDTNLYFTYSEGFKSGAFNASDTSPDGGPFVLPEKIRAYEVGVKSRPVNWLDVNLAAFYYEYQDIQVNAYKTLNGIPVAILQNAASATIKGIDAEVVAKPLTGLTLQVGLSLLDATFDEFDDAAVLDPTTIGGVAIGGNTSSSKNISGNRLVRSPKWTLNFLAAYTTAFAGGDLELSTQVYHSDKFFFENGNRISQPAYTTVGARASWTPDNTGVTFSLFGKNLTDEAVRQGAFVTEIADGVSFAPPRTFGGEVAYRF